MKIVKMCAAGALAMTVASAANAGTIGLNYLGTGQTRDISVTYNGANGSFGGGDNTQTVRAGQLRFEVTSVSGAAANHFSAGDQVTSFCVDIFQNAQSGTVNFGGLENAPDPNNSSAMGAQRASLISVLFALRSNDALTTAGGQGQTNAAALQLAIWEIVHEDNANLAGNTFAETCLDVQNDGMGVFFAGSANATQVTVQTLANQWLQEAWTAWASGADGMHLAAAYGNNFQDVVLIIPLPAPALMAGLGLLAIPVLRRKFC